MSHGERNPKDRIPKSERNPNPKIRIRFRNGLPWRLTILQSLHGFLQIEPKIRFNSLASCQSTRASFFRFGSAVATILSQYLVSLDSFRQVPMLFLKSLFETASSASQ